MGGKADEITVPVEIIDRRDLDLDEVATVDYLGIQQAVVFTILAQPGTVIACGTNALEFPGDIDLSMYIGTLSKRPDCACRTPDVKQLCAASLPYEPDEPTEVYAVVSTKFQPTYDARIKCVKAADSVPDDLPKILDSPAGTGYVALGTGFKVVAAYNFDPGDYWAECKLDLRTGVLIRMLGTPGSVISCDTESDISFGLPGGIDLSMFVGRKFEEPICVSATSITSDEHCDVEVPNDGSTDLVEIFAFMAAEFEAYDATIRCESTE